MASTQTIAVLGENDLKDGQLKEVDFADGKVLLSKVRNEVYATSAFCTHYGAPLAKGVLLSSGRVTCPWHGACFNVCTGDIEDAPGPAAIHSFKTNIKDGKIHVTADPAKVTKENKSRFPSKVISVKQSFTSTSPGVVIVGGGSGAIGTIIGLRERGYEGRVTVISAEPHAPIDRTKLSKALITDAKSLEWYDEDALRNKFGVDLRTGVHVRAVDVENKKVTLEDGEKVEYRQLVLATGALPKRLPIPGKDLSHVYVLRSVEDTQKINSALGEGKSLVIVGSSFIGMELLVAVAKRGLKEIHVVGMTKYPFEAVLGAQVGAGIQQYHESNGVKFHGQAKTTAITDSSVSIEYDSGEKISVSADVVVMAVGVGPATEYWNATEKNKDGGLVVDEYLRVKGVEDVYAIGDIAVFPDPTTGNTARVEHWNVAQNHGRAVASFIAGEPLVFDKTPIFWSAQGQQLRYVGNGMGFEDVILQGDPGELKFVAYYTKGDKVIALAAMQADPLPMKVSELMRLGLMLSASEIRSGKDPLSIDLSSTPVSLRHGA